MEWISTFTAWLLSLVKSVFTSLWDFVTDVFISLIDLILTAFVSLISAIPVPDFIQGGLQSSIDGLDGTVLYILAQVRLPEALALIGVGYAFRLVRKFVTLFQW